MLEDDVDKNICMYVL